MQQILEKFIAQSSTLNEISVAYLISQNINESQGLFLASSMPIRDMNMYAVAKGNLVQISANRGASGIDGTIATAAGFAEGHQTTVTLIIGDLAFLHDLNSLLLLSSISQKLVIIVLNNNGGGIFSFLPIAQFPQFFEAYFGTPHSLSFEKIVKNFNLNYYQSETKESLCTIYQQALQKENSTIIEIQTNRKENFRLHQQLQNQIISVLQENI